MCNVILELYCFLVRLAVFGESHYRLFLVRGQIRVFTDGEQVYDKQADAFDVDEIVRRVRDHV